LKLKRKALQTDAETLSSAADDFSDQAEKLQKLPLLAKVNGMLYVTSSNRESRATEGTEPAYG